MMKISLAAAHSALAEMIGGDQVFSPASPLKLALIKEDFDEAAVLATQTPPEAWSSLGLSPKDIAGCVEGFDEDGNHRIYFQQDEGGYFETSGAPAEGDKIYGFMITTSDGLYARFVEKYDEPVELVSAYQAHVVTTEELSLTTGFNIDA